MPILERMHARDSLPTRGRSPEGKSLAGRAAAGTGASPMGMRPGRGLQGASSQSQSSLLQASVVASVLPSAKGGPLPPVGDAAPAAVGTPTKLVGAVTVAPAMVEEAPIPVSSHDSMGAWSGLTGSSSSGVHRAAAVGPRVTSGHSYDDEDLAGAPPSCSGPLPPSAGKLTAQEDQAAATAASAAALQAMASMQAERDYLEAMADRASLEKASLQALAERASTEAMEERRCMLKMEAELRMAQAEMQELQQLREDELQAVERRQTLLVDELKELRELPERMAAVEAAAEAAVERSCELANAFQEMRHADVAEAPGYAIHGVDMERLQRLDRLEKVVRGFGGGEETHNRLLAAEGEIQVLEDLAAAHETYISTLTCEQDGLGQVEQALRRVKEARRRAECCRGLRLQAAAALPYSSSITTGGTGTVESSPLAEPVAAYRDVAQDMVPRRAAEPLRPPPAAFGAEGLQAEAQAEARAAGSFESWLPASWRPLQVASPQPPVSSPVGGCAQQQQEQLGPPCNSPGRLDALLPTSWLQGAEQMSASPALPDLAPPPGGYVPGWVAPSPEVQEPHGHAAEAFATAPMAVDGRFQFPTEVPSPGRFASAPAQMAAEAAYGRFAAAPSPLAEAPVPFAVASAEQMGAYVPYAQFASAPGNMGEVEALVEPGTALERDVDLGEACPSGATSPAATEHDPWVPGSAEAVSMPWQELRSGEPSPQPAIVGSDSPPWGSSLNTAALEPDLAWPTPAGLDATEELPPCGSFGAVPADTTDPPFGLVATSPAGGLEDTVPFATEPVPRSPRDSKEHRRDEVTASATGSFAQFGAGSLEDTTPCPAQPALPSSSGVVEDTTPCPAFPAALDNSGAFAVEDTTPCPAQPAPLSSSNAFVEDESTPFEGNEANADPFKKAFPPCEALSANAFSLQDAFPPLESPYAGGPSPFDQDFPTTGLPSPPPPPQLDKNRFGTNFFEDAFTTSPTFPNATSTFDQAAPWPDAGWGFEGASTSQTGFPPCADFAPLQETEAGMSFAQLAPSPFPSGLTGTVKRAMSTSMLPGSSAPSPAQPLHRSCSDIEVRRHEARQDEGLASWGTSPWQEERTDPPSAAREALVAFADAPAPSPQAVAAMPPAPQDVQPSPEASPSGASPHSAPLPAEAEVAPNFAAAAPEASPGSSPAVALPLSAPIPSPMPAPLSPMAAPPSSSDTAAFFGTAEKAEEAAKPSDSIPEAESAQSGPQYPWEEAAGVPGSSGKVTYPWEEAAATSPQLGSRQSVEVAAAAPTQVEEEEDLPPWLRAITGSVVKAKAPLTPAEPTPEAPREEVDTSSAPLATEQQQQPSPTIAPAAAMPPNPQQLSPTLAPAVALNSQQPSPISASAAPVNLQQPSALMMASAALLNSQELSPTLTPAAPPDPQQPSPTFAPAEATPLSPSLVPAAAVMPSSPTPAPATSQPPGFATDVPLSPSLAPETATLQQLSPTLTMAAAVPAEDAPPPPPPPPPELAKAGSLLMEQETGPDPFGGPPIVSRSGSLNAYFMPWGEEDSPKLPPRAQSTGSLKGDARGSTVNPWPSASGEEVTLASNVGPPLTTSKIVDINAAGDSIVAAARAGNEASSTPSAILDAFKTVSGHRPLQQPGRQRPTDSPSTSGWSPWSSSASPPSSTSRTGRSVSKSPWEISPAAMQATSQGSRTSPTHHRPNGVFPTSPKGGARGSSQGAGNRPAWLQDNTVSAIPDPFRSPSRANAEKRSPTASWPVPSSSPTGGQGRRLSGGVPAMASNPTTSPWVSSGQLPGWGPSPRSTSPWGRAN